MGQSCDPAAVDKILADAKVFYDARRVTPGQLASTPETIGAGSYAGPWPDVYLTLLHRQSAQGGPRYQLDLVGRDSPDGPAELLRLASGRWAQAPGEIVVTTRDPSGHQTGPELLLGADVSLVRIPRATSPTQTWVVWVPVSYRSNAMRPPMPSCHDRSGEGASRFCSCITSTRACSMRIPCPPSPMVTTTVSSGRASLIPAA